MRASGVLVPVVPRVHERIAGVPDPKLDRGPASAAVEPGNIRKRRLDSRFGKNEQTDLAENGPIKVS